MENSAIEPTLPDSAQQQLIKPCQGGLQSDIVVVPSHTETRHWIDALTPDHRVIIYTEHFDDGRVFSLGRQIRISGYSGSLIAAGEFLPDQLDSLARCGFNHYLPLPSMTDGIEDTALENLIALPQLGELEHTGYHSTTRE